MVGTGMGAERGVLMRRRGKSNGWMVDNRVGQTGTLTEEAAQVTEVAIGGLAEDAVLAIAAAAESASER